MIVTANEIKKSGVSLFARLLEKTDELIINVRGHNRYVVIDIDRYREFREHELDIAHMQVMQEIKEGKHKTQTASEHIKELTDAL